MDNRYVCNHLRRLVRVMYGTTGKGFYANEIEIEGSIYYEFGSVTPPVKCTVNRAVAIYLICGNLDLL